MRVPIVPAFVLAALLVGYGAVAQTSVDQLMAAVEAKTSELQKVDALLADPDRNRRIAAMTVLLGSGDASFVARAKEVGLISADTEMQQAALKAIFNGGGSFRLVLDISKTEDDKDGIKSWLGTEGSWDEASGSAQYLFSLGEFKKEAGCWNHPQTPYCRLAIAGTSIELSFEGGTGNFHLAGDGQMVGMFRSTSAGKVPVPASIPLIN